jgi:hypothetical protein
MLSMIIAKASAADPRIPANTTPGAVFTICVVSACILWCVFVWYRHYGPGAAPDDAEKY